jgi:periplasmic divalent cation tolerance protein
MTDQPIVIYITTPSFEVGKEIAAVLLEQKLAACVNILEPVHSLYLWENKTQEDTEVLLMIKSRSALLEDRIIPAVLAIHPYELPEIIALPILGGHHAYIHWIEQETRPGREEQD